MDDKLQPMAEALFILLKNRNKLNDDEIRVLAKALIEAIIATAEYKAGLRLAQVFGKTDAFV